MEKLRENKTEERACQLLLREQSSGYHSTLTLKAVYYSSLS